MINKYKEYYPKLEADGDTVTLYVCFRNEKVQVTKEIFLQFFGVHKQVTINDRKHYLIVYKDVDHTVYYDMPREKYYKYQSFVSMEIKEQNIYDRYIEHNDLSDVSLFHKRANKETDNIVSRLYEADLRRALYEGIESLPEVQKRRLLLYYFKGHTLAQIAQKEGCSISAVKYCIDHALRNLRYKINTQNKLKI